MTTVHLACGLWCQLGQDKCRFDRVTSPSLLQTELKRTLGGQAATVKRPSHLVVLRQPRTDPIQPAHQKDFVLLPIDTEQRTVGFRSITLILWWEWKGVALVAGTLPRTVLLATIHSTPSLSSTSLTSLLPSPSSSLSSSKSISLFRESLGIQFINRWSLERAWWYQDLVPCRMDPVSGDGQWASAAVLQELIQSVEKEDDSDWRWWTLINERLSLYDDCLTVAERSSTSSLEHIISVADHLFEDPNQGQAILFNDRLSFLALVAVQRELFSRLVSMDLILDDWGPQHAQQCRLWQRLEHQLANLRSQAIHPSTLESIPIKTLCQWWPQTKNEKHESKGNHSDVDLCRWGKTLTDKWTAVAFHGHISLRRLCQRWIQIMMRASRLWSI